MFGSNAVRKMFLPIISIMLLSTGKWLNRHPSWHWQRLYITNSATNALLPLVNAWLGRWLIGTFRESGPMPSIAELAKTASGEDAEVVGASSYT